MIVIKGFNYKLLAYFLICLVAVLYPLFPLLKEKNIAISDLEKLRWFITHELAITIPIYVRFGDKGFVFPDLIQATQLQLDNELQNLIGNNWRFKLVDELDNQQVNHDDAGKYIIEMVHGNEDSVFFNSELFKVDMFYTSAIVHANDLPFFLTQTILYHLMLPDIELEKNLGVSKKRIELESNMDIHIILFEPRENNYLPIIEEALNSTFDPFKRKLLVLSELSKTIKEVNSFKEEDFFPENPNRALYFFISNIENEPYIPSTIVNSYNISYITTNLLSELGSISLISGILEEIETFMGLPKNPTNNLSIRVEAMKRYATLQGLLDTIDNISKLHSTRSVTSNENEIQELIKPIFGIIDMLHENDSEHEWNDLFSNSMDLKQRSTALYM